MTESKSRIFKARSHYGANTAGAIDRNVKLMNTFCQGCDEGVFSDGHYPQCGVGIATSAVPRGGEITSLDIKAIISDVCVKKQQS